MGPLGSSSFNLPNVERALNEMESGVGPSGFGERGASARLGAGRTGGTAGTSVRPAGLTPLGASTPTSVARSPVSPSSSGGIAQSPGGGQSQHEVLQNFFQSLLSTKDRNAGNVLRSGAATAKTNGATTTSNEEGN